LCGQPLQDILANEALLFSNRIAQPMVVAATLAMWEAVKGFLPAPVLVAGYSVGELAAWSVAGSLESEAAIHLAATRASLMDACVIDGRQQALIAISAPRAAGLATLLQAHGFFIAIQSGEDSVIAGGLLANAAALESDITRAGGRTSRLPIAVASHTPWMKSAVVPFADALSCAAIADPQFPVLAGVSGEPLTRKDQAAWALSRQLADPIRWTACMDACAEAGITVALELGPGAALSRMLHARHPHIECRSAAEFRSIAGIEAWLARRFG